MKFSRLVDFFGRLEGTASRLEMFGILAELFSEAEAEEIDRIVYLSQGRLLPPFEGLEFGISEKYMLRALSDASGERTERVREVYRETGDLGSAAGALVRGEGELSVLEVYGELRRIAETGGRGSVEMKTSLLVSLLRGVSSREARFVVRLVLGRLRLGVGDPTVLEALALSEGDRGLRPELERAYNLCSDLGLLARTLKAEGLEKVRGFRVRVGYPIRVALCERVPASTDVLEKTGGRAAVEAKYDGIRLQFHRDGERVEVFSRNLERMTDMFPELTGALRELPCKQAILEGEALVHNETTGELMPFQVTIQRRRKHGVEEKAREFPLRFFAFELLYLDGTDYTERPYTERRKKLEEILSGSAEAGRIVPAEMRVIEEAEEIKKYFEEAIERGLEGLIAKRLDSLYTAGARNYNWIKLKRSYRGELADTLDLAVVGYFHGRGSRAALGVGGLLGAVYDRESESFKSVSKIGSGFSEEGFRELSRLFEPIALKHRHPRVESGVEADVWLEPRYVVTVTADEVTRSPSHAAGRGEDGLGYALRFPRAMGELRADKNPEDANTVEDIIGLYEGQRKVQVK